MAKSNVSGAAIIDTKESLSRERHFDKAGNIRFRGSVTYSSSQNEVEEDIEVRIILLGWEAFDTHLSEGTRITAESHHLLLKPAFQTFTFDRENRCLLIEGHSEKMAGEYKVKIRLPE